MRFLDLAKTRYSVRKYHSTPVEEEKLAYVLEAARWAPTAANRQPFQLIVINTAGREDDLLRMYYRDFIIEAPIVICAIGLPDEAYVRVEKNFVDMDVAIIMDHMTLAAKDVGLGTCWIGTFNPHNVREILGLPENAEPFALTPLGYPADEIPIKERKPLDQLVRYEKW